MATRFGAWGGWTLVFGGARGYRRPAMTSTELSAGLEDFRAALARLPQRQREALELRDRALSHEQIATRLGLDAGSVAQLIARARINLYDELRGTALASIAAPPECERALPLIAAREDAELEAGSEEAAWLEAHLAGCERCRLADEQMRDAASCYRGGSSLGARSRSSETTAVTPAPRPSRKAVTRAAAGLAALLLLAGLAVAAVVGGGGRDSGDPAAANAASRQSHRVSPRVAKRARATHQGRKRRNRRGKSGTAANATTSLTAGGTTPTSAVTPAPLTASGEGSNEPASGPDGSSVKAAIQPIKQTTGSTPTPKPKPAPPESTPSSQPPPEPAPPATTTEAESRPPAEEAGGPGHSGEPPAKATGNPHGAPPGQQ